jgi:thiol-disulfide isomerase/thioredoxin
VPNALCLSLAVGDSVGTARARLVRNDRASSLAFLCFVAPCRSALFRAIIQSLPTRLSGFSQCRARLYRLAPADARQSAPDFTLTDLRGGRVSLTQYRGHVVLLDFWAVDCGGCRIEIPWYVQFDRQYRRRGLSLIGLDMYGESPQKILPFLREERVGYSIAVGTDEIGSLFHLTEMPLTLLIDREGRITVSHAGIVDRAAFENDIRQMLAER